MIQHNPALSSPLFLPETTRATESRPLSAFHERSTGQCLPLFVPSTPIQNESIPSLSKSEASFQIDENPNTTLPAIHLGYFRSFCTFGRSSYIDRSVYGARPLRWPPEGLPPSPTATACRSLGDRGERPEKLHTRSRLTLGGNRHRCPREAIRNQRLPLKTNNARTRTFPVTLSWNRQPVR